MIRVSSLKKNPKNPRQIKGEKLELLKKSVASFQKMMALRPMIVDENNIVLGGNMRLAAIKALGHKEIPDEWVKRADDLTEAEKREFIIKDNAGFGEWDWDVIANEWSDEPLADWGLDVPGFEAVEEVGEADAEPQIDKAAELNKKWKVKSGDLWQIGVHRLLCGDSTKREDVERLMGGQKAVLMNTDPPYGDSWVKKAQDMQEHGYGHSHAVLHGSIENDDLDEGELFTFLRAFLDVAKVAGDAPMPTYVWHGAKRMLFEQALKDSGWFVHQPIVWVKPSFVIGRLHYHPRCEWALHGWRQGNGKCPFYGERNQSDVWDVDRENEKIHPTQKPIELFIRPIHNHTKTGEIVYEPFAGSGSQFVAAENTKRKCFGVELQEGYVATILERMATAFPDIEIKRIDQATAAKT